MGLDRLRPTPKKLGDLADTLNLLGPTLCEFNLHRVHVAVLRGLRLHGDLPHGKRHRQAQR